jgi:hypothetical protein
MRIAAVMSLHVDGNLTRKGNMSDASADLLSN